MPTIDYEQLSGEPPSTSPSPPQPKPKTKILSLFLVGFIMITIFSLFLLLIGIASVLILPLLLSSLHRHHRLRRRRHRSNRRRESSNGLSSNFVKKLPQFKSHEPNSLDCVVCLDGFRQGQWCRNLPDCGHVFHRKCVDFWLLKSATCPICRANVRLREEDEQEQEILVWS